MASKLVEERLSRGLCTTCGRPNDRVELGRHTCSVCTAAYYKYQQRREAAFQCYRCGQPLGEDRGKYKCCAACRERINKNRKNKRNAVKKKKTQSLSEIVAICKAEGISYGQWAAREQLRDEMRTEGW